MPPACPVERHASSLHSEPPTANSSSPGVPATAPPLLVHPANKGWPAFRSEERKLPPDGAGGIDRAHCGVDSSGRATRAVHLRRDAGLQRGWDAGGSPAVRSVIAQSFANWELVLVEDCSTDGSGGIAEGLAAGDAMICLIRKSENTGVGPRGTSACAARGRVVT